MKISIVIKMFLIIFGSLLGFVLLILTILIVAGHFFKEIDEGATSGFFGGGFLNKDKPTDK